MGSELQSPRVSAISQGDNITNPLQDEIDKQRKKIKEKDAVIADLNNQVNKLKNNNHKLTQALKDNLSNSDDDGMASLSDIEKLSNKFSKQVK